MRRQGIRSQNYIVRWKTPIVEQGGEPILLAYEKTAETDSGLILMNDGTIQQVATVPAASANTSLVASPRLSTAVTIVPNATSAMTTGQPGPPPPASNHLLAREVGSGFASTRRTSSARSQREKARSPSAR